MPAGRPSAYKPEYCEQARKLARLGATDADLADFFGVNVSTVYRWKAEHPEFCESTKIGKDDADDAVEQSLYRRAMGYSHDAVKVFQFEGRPVKVPITEHYPPDTGAAIFWLKNRRPARWRDKTEVHVTRPLGEMTDDELARIAAGGSAGDPAAPGGPAKPH